MNFHFINPSHAAFPYFEHALEKEFSPAAMVEGGYVNVPSAANASVRQMRSISRRSLTPFWPFGLDLGPGDAQLIYNLARGLFSPPVVAFTAPALLRWDHWR